MTIRAVFVPNDIHCKINNTTTREESSYKRLRESGCERDAAATGKIQMSKAGKHKPNSATGSDTVSATKEIYLFSNIRQTYVKNIC